MIRTVGVIGAGTMGNGIAQVFAQNGFSVQLHDAAAASVDKAFATFEKSLGKCVEKVKLSAGDRDATMGRLGKAAKLEDLAGVDYVVEAIFENVDAKRQVLSRLDAITRPEVILGTN